jgi:hypothetical protein
MPKAERGKGDEYDEKYWREKCHYDKSGIVYIPQMSFKMALDSAARLKGERIPGKGQSTYTKRFMAGVLVLEPLSLGVPVKEIEHDHLYVNADGVRGSGKRVWKRFPRFDSWSGDVEFHVLSDEIPKDVFESTLRASGQFVGIGRFRPENGGFYGRFEVTKVTWS